MLNPWRRVRGPHRSAPHSFSFSPSPCRVFLGDFRQQPGHGKNLLGIHWSGMRCLAALHGESKAKLKAFQAKAANVEFTELSKCSISTRLRQIKKPLNYPHYIMIIRYLDYMASPSLPSVSPSRSSQAAGLCDVLWCLDSFGRD